MAWLDAWDEALQLVKQRADSFGLAPEVDHRGDPVRQILFKTKRGRMYRALFVIRGSNVRILHVRGPGQNLIGLDELQ